MHRSVQLDAVTDNDLRGAFMSEQDRISPELQQLDLVPLDVVSEPDGVPPHMHFGRVWSYRREEAFEAGIDCVLGGDDSTSETEESAQHAELRHVLVAPLIEHSRRAASRAEGTGHEEYEEEEDFGDEGGEDDGGRIVRLSIGSRMLRKKRARTMLLTQLLRRARKSPDAS